MKKYIISTLIILTVNFAFAQDFFDALKFSQTEYGGTARSIAMGSAFGALGGDFVSASINPAGLGLYRSGEFVLSPTLNLNQIESNYLNNTEINDKYSFNFNNASYVVSSKTGAETGIISFTFGVGYNRLKNFNSNSLVQGYGANTSLLNYFTDYANEYPNQFDNHYEGLAWNAMLINKDTDPEVLEGIYYNDLTDYQKYDINDENGNFIGSGYEAVDVFPHKQKNIIRKNGHIDEYLISLGLNINHKVYIGASLGLLDLVYNEKTMYSEIDNENYSDYLSDYTLESDLYESGFGINFKTGIIYRPTKSLRFGAAIHTPNFYDISKSDQKKITSNFDLEIGTDETNLSSKWSDDNEQIYDYRLETPLKANFSVAYILGNKAIISADYELINYGNAKFRNSGDNYDYSDQNSDINNTLKTTGNIRIGAEYRLTNNLSARAGLNLIGNPWKSTYTYSDGTPSEIENKNDSFVNYSGGFGYRQKNFFIDFAYRLSQNNYAYKVHEIYYTNPTNGSSIASLKEMNNQTTITFGFRF
ncbi:MAG: hypothetical protein PF541_10625 [Prolixibacteraceae bacterium]|jgi:hypothetical protein|nr:hypothetical protein [Prolixibacteraceae bacterium]